MASIGSSGCISRAAQGNSKRYARRNWELSWTPWSPSSGMRWNDWRVTSTRVRVTNPVSIKDEQGPDQSAAPHARRQGGPNRRVGYVSRGRQRGFLSGGYHSKLDSSASKGPGKGPSRI